MPTGNYGTAKLRTEGHDNLTSYWDRSDDFSGFNGVILGENEWLPSGVGVIWNPTQRAGMALTVGGARLGKGASTVIPALLGYSGSCVVIDIKGELAWITAKRRRALGQRVVILDPFGEVNRSFGDQAGTKETVTNYNPLAYLDPSSKSFADDISAVCEALLWNQGSGDPFFIGYARDLVAGLIAAVVQMDPGFGSLPEVRDLLNLPEDVFAARCLQICEMPEMSGTVAQRKLLAFTKETRTNSAIIATCKEQTAFLDSEEMREFLQSERDPFTFAALTQERTTVYVVLPSTHLETHARFLRLSIAQGIRHIERNRPKLTSPVVFFLDEMGTALGPMPMVENAWGKSSGYGLVLWGFVQDLNQLKRDYPKSWETFVANSAMIQLIGARDPFTSNFFSDYLGKCTIETIQRSTSTSTNTGSNQSVSGNASTSSGYQGGSSSTGTGWSRGTSFGTSESQSINISEIGKPLLDPEQIRTMGNDKTLVIFPGEIPYQLTRLVYFRDPRFYGLYRPDPHYPRPTAEGSLPPKRRDPEVVAREQAAAKEAADRAAAAAAEAERQRRIQAERSRQEALRKKRQARNLRIAVTLCVLTAGYFLTRGYFKTDWEKIAETQQNVQTTTQADLQAAQKRAAAIPPLPASETAAIRMAEEIEHAKEKTYDGFDFKPLRVTPGDDGVAFKPVRTTPNPSDTSFTIWGIETIRGRHALNPSIRFEGNRYRNIILGVVKDGDGWKARVITVAAESDSFDDLLYLDRKSF